MNVRQLVAQLTDGIDPDAEVWMEGWASDGLTVEVRAPIQSIEAYRDRGRPMVTLMGRDT